MIKIILWNKKSGFRIERILKSDNIQDIFPLDLCLGKFSLIKGQMKRFLNDTKNRSRKTA